MLPDDAASVYIAAAVNRTTHVADWAQFGTASILLYAANKAVAVWADPGQPGSRVTDLVQTGFSKPVTALKYARCADQTIAVIGSGDGSIAVLASDDGAHWARKAVVKDAHVGSVSALGVLRPSAASKGGAFFVSGASDGLLKVWTVDATLTPTLAQTIELNGRFPLDATLLELPGDAYLLALATTTRKIDLYAAPSGEPFTHKLVLEGHEDWVRSVDLCAAQTGNALMLASGAQDGSVRLWKIAPAHEAPAPQGDEFERMVSKIEADRAGELATRALPFAVAARRWAVTFDALLLGHDTWLTGVRWHPCSADTQPAALLSSSADNSLILWTPSGSNAGVFPVFDAALLANSAPASSIWMPAQRFGEVGGASNLGFFGALWHPAAPAVFAHGWGGSAHIWTLPPGSTAQQAWSVASPVTGHFGAARSVAWEPSGEYLLSCGDDQTTRLHAQPGAHGAWHEVARPQSHGYDLHAVTWLDRLSFVSAADEKVLRVFSAPRGFVGTAGPHGLAFANLRGPATLLFLELDASIGLLRSAQRHGDLLRQAMRTHYTSPQHTLTALIASPLFEAPVGTSFKQVELYLKWMYAQAWSVAVEKDYMLADINVLLCPTSRTEPTLRMLLAHDPTVLVDMLGQDALVRTLSASPPTPLASNTGYDTAVGSDDARGLVTYPVVALGGTFDHLHVGHKILLSMATLLAERKLIVGVTDDAMLGKKAHAPLLESIDGRIAAVSAFIGLFRLAFGTPLTREVVKLEDVAGPAATEAELQALVVTDETLSGAEFIANKRRENGLGGLAEWVIGVVGSGGETDLRGDAKALADSKIGSTAIRAWLSRAGPRRAHALSTLTRGRTARYAALTDPSAGEQTRPVGASVPPLGLSNRAVFEGAAVAEEASASGQPIGKPRESLAAVLHAPPSEEQLAVETLWPELEKLYGHGYELLWAAANPASASCAAGRFVASCCRASSADHAVVRIHDAARNWAQTAQLTGHSLSITRIAWSADARYVLSCSRDRSWRIYARDAHDEFSPHTGERSHARIIWDADWSKDPATPHTFATASRDKSVKIFRLCEGAKPFELLHTLALESAATAVAFGVGSVLAVGQENGTVLVYQQRAGEWTQVLRLPLASEQINQLQFRPPVLHDADAALLACAAQDGSVRIVRLTLP